MALLSHTVYKRQIITHQVHHWLIEFNFHGKKTTSASCLQMASFKTSKPSVLTLPRKGSWAAREKFKQKLPAVGPISAVLLWCFFFYISWRVNPSVEIKRGQMSLGTNAMIYNLFSWLLEWQPFLLLQFSWLGHRSDHERTISLHTKCRQVSVGNGPWPTLVV